MTNQQKVTNEPAQTAGDGEIKKAENLVARGIHAVGHRAKPWMERASRAVREPAIAAVVAGGAVAAAAGLWGPTEAAMGVLAAYAVYTVTRRHGRAEKAAK